MSYTGIDISHWNRARDWGAISEVVNFAFIKAAGEERGIGSYRKDVCFEKFYYDCKEHSIPVGCYFFMGNQRDLLYRGPGEVVEKLLDQISRLELDMPIVIDCEAQFVTNKFYVGRYVEEWCKRIEEAGYYAMIYASDSYFGKNGFLPPERVSLFDKWIARYNDKGLPPKNSYGIWQYTSNGRVAGIKGNVDMNKTDRNYPAIIRKAGLNHLKEERT